MYLTHVCASAVLGTLYTHIACTDFLIYGFGRFPYICYVSQGCMRRAYLRNEFHFSGVHGAMNRSGSRAK